MSCRAVASRTEGFQAGDLVTLIERAISHSELRALCPVVRPPGPFEATPPSYHCQCVSIESASDLSTSLELSTSPQKQHSFPLAPPPPPFTPPGQRQFDLLPGQLDSGISSPIIPQVKRISVVSASSLTPTTPHSSMGGRTVSGSLPPMTRVGSLSSMVLTVQDFVTALEGFVPVTLRGLPLHTSGSVSFSHVGGLEDIKQTLRETLLWPSKVRRSGGPWGGGGGVGGRGASGVRVRGLEDGRFGETRALMPPPSLRGLGV